MGKFKNLTNNTYIFTKKGKKDFKSILSLEKVDHKYIITYLDQTIKENIQITEKNINNYIFLKKSGRKMYKIYEKTNITSLIKEMDTGDAGIGGTAQNTFSGDFYAPDDARNIFGDGDSKKYPMVKRPKITDTVMKTTKSKKRNKKSKNGKSKS